MDAAISLPLLDDDRRQTFLIRLFLHFFLSMNDPLF